MSEEFDVKTQSGEEETGKGGKRPAKPAKPSRGEKKAARAAAHDKAKSQKEWEDNLVASKRVKREEHRRKWKKAFLVLLVFSLALTSIVYVMLLLIEKNSIRITASSSADKTISLSIDRANWTPYLDIRGPENMWNVTYNPDYRNVYEQNPIPTISQVTAFVEAEEPVGGNWSRENIIQFSFFLRNTTPSEIGFSFEMQMMSDSPELVNCLRVVWGESFSDTVPDRARRSVNCYAAPSTDARLVEYNGGIEKIAYPMSYPSASGSTVVTADSFRELDAALSDESKAQTGWLDTIPFESGDLAFRRSNRMAQGEMMFVYVVVWIEGSDFDCNDNALNKHAAIRINFSVD